MMTNTTSPTPSNGASARPFILDTTPVGTASTAAQPALVLCELADPGVPGLESYSPYCLKTHRALFAAGLAYTSRRASRPAEHKALNPAAQVPVLLVDGRPVPDSTDILRELLRIRPGVFAASAEDWLWEELGDSALNGFLVAARWGDDRSWPLVREAYFSGMPAPVKAIVPNMLRRNVVKGLRGRGVLRAGEEACWARFTTLLDQLEGRAPESGFWTGAQLSVADLGLFGQLRSLRTDLTPWQRDQVERRRRLRRWLDRVDLATRPAR